MITEPGFMLLTMSSVISVGAGRPGAFRLTENEYSKAKEYKSDYGVLVISNLEDMPKMSVIYDPIKNIQFTQHTVDSKQLNFHSKSLDC